MNGWISTLMTFILAATFQNVVLTTGLGASAMLKIVRRPRGRRSFGVLLVVFSVLTTALFYPLDRALPTTWLTLMLRPLMIVVIALLLYMLAVVLFYTRFPEQYRRLRQILPLSAINNLVIGITLLGNYQVSLGFFPAVALSAGSAVGFLLLSSITAEGISRTDNPDTPASFRGLPATLVYLGLLALALMGFNPTLNLL